MDSQDVEPVAGTPPQVAPLVSNGVYDKLKSFLQLVGPAMITFYIFIGNTLSWENTETYAGIATALLTMLGVLVTWLASNFKNSDARFDGEIKVTENEDGIKQAALILRNYIDPSEVINQKEVTFRVSR